MSNYSTQDKGAHKVYPAKDDPHQFDSSKCGM